MKKTICALGTAALLFGLLTTAMAEKEALHFSEDSHSFIVTSEGIGRSEYGETAFDIRVTMDGNEIQTINFTAENVNEGQRETVLCDVNMDGYADLALMNSMGASDGFASYYLYEPMTGQFVIIRGWTGCPSTARSFTRRSAMCSITCTTARRRAFGNCINGRRMAN